MIDDMLFPNYVAMDREEKERQRSERERQRKERGKKKAAERRRRLNVRKREFLKRAKEKRGCQRCGIKDPRVLDFYNPHGSGVTMRRAARLSWAQIEEGLENCLVLCANCRRIVLMEDRRDAALH